MKKSSLKLNAIMLAFILIFDILYMFKGGLFFKSIASILFVATGFINILQCIKNKTDLKFPIWMMVALIFAMLGDILLVINFYTGTALFAIGHIFYFVSYCMLQKINCKDFIWGIGISIVAISIILFTPFLDFGDPLMYGVCCGYAFIISFMVGKTISNMLKENNSTNRIIVIGSILFFFSDFLLMLNKFGGMKWASYMCLGSYYPAQFILAFSLLIFTSVNNKKINKVAA